MIGYVCKSVFFFFDLQKKQVSHLLNEHLELYQKATTKQFLHSQKKEKAGALSKIALSMQMVTLVEKKQMAMTRNAQKRALLKENMDPKKRRKKSQMMRSVHHHTTPFLSSPMTSPHYPPGVLRLILTRRWKRMRDWLIMMVMWWIWIRLFIRYPF